MPATDRFFDTNVILYLLSEDKSKADRAEELLQEGGVISVQVLNEFSSVGLRKLKMTVAEIREVLSIIRTLCHVVPLTEEAHDRGLDLVRDRGFSLYDAMIVATAELTGCTVLFSEDMQHGQSVEGRLKILNPFR